MGLVPRPPPEERVQPPPPNGVDVIPPPLRVESPPSPLAPPSSSGSYEEPLYLVSICSHSELSLLLIFKQQSCQP